MISAGIAKVVERLFHKETKVTPRQKILDDLVLLKIKRDQIQVLRNKGERLDGVLGSVQKEIVAKVAEYKQTLDR